MNKFFSLIGIVLVFAGTVFSLWSVLNTKSSTIGTANYHDHQQEYFKKDKAKVILGTTLIFIGSLSQIIGLFI